MRPFVVSELCLCLISGSVAGGGGMNAATVAWRLPELVDGECDLCVARKTHQSSDNFNDNDKWHAWELIHFDTTDWSLVLHDF